MKPSEGGIPPEIYRCTWCGWEKEHEAGDPWPQCERCYWEFFFALGLRPKTLMIPASESAEAPAAAARRFRFRDRDGQEVWTTLPPVGPNDRGDRRKDPA